MKDGMNTETYSSQTTIDGIYNEWYLYCIDTHRRLKNVTQRDDLLKIQQERESEVFKIQQEREMSYSKSSKREK